MFSYPMFRELEREQTSFTGIAAHCLFGVNVTVGGVTDSADSLLSPAATSRLSNSHPPSGGSWDQRMTA